MNWRARPAGAVFVTAGAIALPALGGLAGLRLAASLLPAPVGAVGTIGWWAAVIAAGAVPVIVLARLARRALPLRWLLGLSLAFPGEAPSRFSVAWQAARPRRFGPAALRQDGHRLDSGEARAAESALVLVAALRDHDRRSRDHSERVRAVAELIAAEARVPAEDRVKLRWSALLHDIGKLRVPSAVLNKPGRPDPDEWAVIRRHPAEGRRLIAPLAAWLGPWADGVADHHEHFDGSGYPHGLRGTGISLGGRIIAVADAYEVLTAARPYKRPSTPEAARRELVHAAGSQLDPELVRALLNVSLARLWWMFGAAGFVAQLPLLGRLWTNPAAERVRRDTTAAAATAAAVAALAVTGFLHSADTRFQAGGIRGPVPEASAPPQAVAPSDAIGPPSVPDAGQPNRAASAVSAATAGAVETGRLGRPATTDEPASRATAADNVGGEQPPGETPPAAPVGPAHPPAAPDAPAETVLVAETGIGPGGVSAAVSATGLPGGHSIEVEVAVALQPQPNPAGRSGNG